MPPPKLLATLLPYQEEAVRWCLDREEQGGILAYDMGLGKTVIACAVMVARPMKTLVMLPTSLLSQWAAEVAKHTTGLSVSIYHGPARQKNRGELFEADIVLSTPAIVGRDIHNGIEFPQERWIIDEAHRLKNGDGKTYQRLEEGAHLAKYKLLLTGTPICNQVSDLVSLICLTNFEPYNHSSFWKGMHMPKKVKTVKKISEQVLLRRTKEDTIPELLPTLTIKPVPVFLPEGIQTDTYEYFLDDEKILRRILRMRQASNNHKLLGKEIAPHDEARLTEYETSELSVKVDALRKILEAVPLGEKVLVFSQFTSLLFRLCKELNYGAEEAYLYHGGLNAEQKSQMIETFKSSPTAKILYINLRAGGCGLNLVEANHVVMLEPYWNESEQKQAIDRVFRIGQQRPVTIYKLFIRNSIESWLQKLQHTKKHLAASMIDKLQTPEKAAEELTRNQMETDNLFQYVGYTSPNRKGVFLLKNNGEYEALSEALTKMGLY